MFFEADFYLSGLRFLRSNYISREEAREDCRTGLTQTSAVSESSVNSLAALYTNNSGIESEYQRHDAAPCRVGTNIRARVCVCVTTDLSHCSLASGIGC